MALAMARKQKGPAPSVNREQAQREGGGMIEDMGVLQGTVIRAPFSKLPTPLSWAFWNYFWTLVKAKGTAVYS